MTTIDTLTLARKHRLCLASLHVLLIVIRDGRATPTCLAIDTLITTASVTGACDTLVDGGWVDRTSNPRDRRSWVLTPTAKALDTFPKEVLNQ